MESTNAKNLSLPYPQHHCLRCHGDGCAGDLAESSNRHRWNGVSRTTATLEPVRSQSTLPPLSIDTIEIQTIIGIGDLENERVQLVSVAKEAVDLSGWGISGGKGLVYRFPR